jgi:predicted GH43/DUF377 family glycosyl hydrolase
VDDIDQMVSAPWEKRGIIFRPDPTRPWMRTHAGLATPLHIEGDRYRIFFSSRDSDNRAHVGAFELDLSNPIQPLAVTEDPVLAPGPVGHFDEHGVLASSVVKDDDVVYMYTIGWNRGERHPMYYASVGLAVSSDGGRSFAKQSNAPLLSRSEHDPCFVSGPFVLKEGGRWRMWYISCFRWDEIDGALHSKYDVKYAESSDGINWQRNGTVAIPIEGNERNIGRACVIRVGGSGYEAWFSTEAGDGYRMHCATSVDGISWKRDLTRPLVEPTEDSFDSECVAHPFVLHHDGRAFAFYSGNRFGQDGVGMAIRAL